jgi:homoserine O-succinyltransferase/O-acetyltransferase
MTIQQQYLRHHYLYLQMFSKQKNELKIALLDLYEGHENQGMRCLRSLVHEFGQSADVNIALDEFEVRLKQQLPDLGYDMYISSGGPGSPLDSENSDWENAYFAWIELVRQYNLTRGDQAPKPVFFICHSFQLACRFFNIATVAKRKSTAFGVFPVHMLPSGEKEKIFDGLHDPFYAVDSRDYQVIQPKQNVIRAIGAKILAIEKERPHVPFERAIMAVRFNDYMIGTQFHPEADAVGMSMYLQRDDKKKTVIENHGVNKWESMITQLNDPDKIRYTYSHVIPNFLHQLVKQYA